MISIIPFFAVSFFILGLIIGSFLNVVICRFHTSRSFGGRSACMSCQNKLSWYELIPLFSFLMLQGRCGNCKTKISMQYPLVEFITGLIFVALFFKFKDIFYPNILVFAVTYAYYAIMFSFLIVITVYDLKHKIIPDTLSFSFGLFAFIGLFFFHNNNFFVTSGFYYSFPTILEFLSGVLVSLPFALLWFVSAGAWMGLGDAKLVLGLGWFLGLSRALSAITIAFWVGAIVGLCFIIFKKGYGMKSEIPFALYLTLGTFLALIFELHLFIF